VGILVLLKYWGDAKQQADQYIKKVEEEDKRKKEDNEKVKQVEEERKRKEQDSRMQDFMSKQDVRQSMQLVPYETDENGEPRRAKDTMALVEYIHKKPGGKIGRKA
jgi:hypothetical protein